jgi:excisionase family DNA binding protein
MKKSKHIYEDKIDRILSTVLRLEEGMNVLLEERKKEMLSVKEVCDMLKISRSKYKRYVADGTINQIQPGGRNTKVSVSRREIEDLINEGKI